MPLAATKKVKYPASANTPRRKLRLCHRADQRLIDEWNAQPSHPPSYRAIFERRQNRLHTEINRLKHKMRQDTASEADVSVVLTSLED